MYILTFDCCLGGIGGAYGGGVEGGCGLGEVTSLSGSKYSPSSFIWTAEILYKFEL